MSKTTKSRITRFIGLLALLAVLQSSITISQPLNAKALLSSVRTAPSMQSAIAPQCRRTGGARHELWRSVNDSLIKNLLQDKRYPSFPDETRLLDKLETTANVDDDYGTRIRGYLCPPQSGDYMFWLASDDQGELWLSSDATATNRTLIASIDDWTYFREWSKYATQHSSTVRLTAHQAYYFEVLHKESVNDDNLSVAWMGPGIPFQVIDGRYLAPYADNQNGDSILYLPLVNR